MKKNTKKTKKKSSVRLVNQPLSEWRVFAGEFDKHTETYDEHHGYPSLAPDGVVFMLRKVYYDSKGKPKDIVEYPDTAVRLNYSDYEGKDKFQRPLHKAEQESRQNLRDIARAWNLPILERIDRTGDYRIREWKGTKEINRLERMCDCPKRPRGRPSDE